MIQLREYQPKLLQFIPILMTWISLNIEDMSYFQSKLLFQRSTLAGFFVKFFNLLQTTLLECHLLGDLNFLYNIMISIWLFLPSLRYWNQRYQLLCRVGVNFICLLLVVVHEALNSGNLPPELNVLLNIKAILPALSCISIPSP